MATGNGKGGSVSETDGGGPTFTEAAPAKVNLTLTVSGRRPDGYHQLESLVVFAGDGAADHLRLSPGGPFRLELTGPGAATLAADAKASPNLIEKAVAAVIAEAPMARVGTFQLRKELPVAAGIGGGSSDAAAALRLLRRANPELAERLDWSRIGASIGADVPVCLESRASLMSGVGERVTPLAGVPPMWAVLANPRVSLSTADVFRALDAPSLHASNPDAPAPIAPQFADFPDLVRYMTARENALEAPARRLCPIISDVLSMLSELDGAVLARMSGSGPTCFALFGTCEDATAVAGRLAMSRPEWWVEAAALQ